MRSCFAVAALTGNGRLRRGARADVRHSRRAEPGEYGLREHPTIHCTCHRQPRFPACR